MSAPEITVSTGTLRGRALQGGGGAYLGVPYAAPPVGELRYAAPAPAAAWDGVRDATAFGPPAPQPERALAGLDTRSFMGPRWRGEDPELTVNVWTPGPPSAGPWPVMVWVHGGAFVAGGPAAGCYDGSAFARDGVVLVSVTYRLGAEGFLALEGGVTNPGIRDQQAALQWVRREIGAFGGDPDRVTAFGQSAGSMTLGALLASPAGRGLARRVILQSGGAQLALSAAQGTLVAEQVARLIGVAPTAAAFRGVPIADVMAAQARLLPGTMDLTAGGEADPTGTGMLYLLPVRDGDVVPHDPLAAAAACDLEVLIGDTTQEGNLYVAGVPDADLALAVPLTEGLFRRPIAALAAAHRSSGRPTFVYEFDWRSGALGGRLGAAHAVELPFVFDTLDAPGLRGDDALLGADGGPQELADRMHGAWTRFARDGDPGWAPDAVQVFA